MGVWRLRFQNLGVFCDGFSGNRCGYLGKLCDLHRIALILIDGAGIVEAKMIG